MSKFVEWFRRWRLLSWRTAIVAVVVIYTIVGFFVVPAIVKSVIGDLARERLGREVVIDEVRANPYALSLTIRGFSLPDRPGTTMLHRTIASDPRVFALLWWESRAPAPLLGPFEGTDPRIRKAEAEIAAMVDALAEFKPTKICLESNHTSTEFQERFDRLLAGDYDLTADERDQVLRQRGCRDAIGFDEAGDQVDRVLHEGADVLIGVERRR